MTSRLLACWLSVVGLAFVASGDVLAGEQFAFLVGVGEYVHKMPDNHVCKTDIDALAAALQDVGYKQSHIRLLSQIEGEKDRPTVENVRKQFKELLLDVGREDTLLVAFSGHGVQFKDQKEVFLCAADAKLGDRSTLIPLSSLYELLANPKLCAARTKVVLLDAVHGDPRLEPASPGVMGDLESGGLIDVGEPPVGITTLVCCSTEQRSRRHSMSGKSVFMHFVIDALSIKGDIDQDGKVSIAELAEYADRNVTPYAHKALNASQTPLCLGERRKASSVAVVRWPERLLHFPDFDPGRPGVQRDDNGLKMTFVWCPAGSFKMGSPPTEPDREADEDAVDVTLSQGFWLGRCEVSRREFSKSGRRDAEGRTDNRPITNVSHWDARTFCQWLTKQERAAKRLPADEEYTLPTEAQWEWACRAGFTTRFSFGQDEETLEKYAWFDRNAKSLLEGVQERGSRSSNAWGLRDMHGNVREWCLDWYQAELKGGSDPAEISQERSSRVCRGGSWRTPAWRCRSAYRDAAASLAREDDLGFRVARVRIAPPAK